MGRRSAERLTAGASHDVLVVHPARDDIRPCRLAFDRHGLGLTAIPTGDDREREILRVPWWAMEGLSADDTDIGPRGQSLQVVRLVTDAGTLSLLLAAPMVPGVLASLGAWASRWARARRPLVRRMARTRAVVGGVPRRAVQRVAGRLGASGPPLPGPLAPLARAAGRRPRAVVATVCAGALSLAAWGGVALGTASGGLGVPQASAAPLSGYTRSTFDASGMDQILEAAEFQAGAAAHLAPAKAPPARAPASVADAPPLGSHETFGFAPYWTLSQEATFDVSGFTTLAYFAVGINANGTLDESGTGWDGYESQDFADLVSRAHAAGDRVVLTVNCFSQQELNALTSSPTAAATLAAAVVHAIAAKNLDGVNLDLEGQGSADQAGLTALVATVSSAVHAANPHDQVTVDTYASSAADPGGFYDVPALAKVVDGIFVMAYETNLDAGPSAASPITSAEYADTTAAAQYAAAVPASKVIFGTGYFGYTWPTSNGTMGATAQGTGVPVTYAQLMASGNPIYWDPVTDTSWTSYEVGHQWYESYVDGPASVYMVAQLAQREGFAGVGAWALGMDGDDPQMTVALDGDAPPERAGPAGPLTTSSSATGPEAHPGTGAGVSTGTISTPTTAPATTGAAPGVGPATSTTGPSTSTPGASYRYAATWNGQSVTLTLQPTAVPSGTGVLQGALDGFTTTNPALACLESTPDGIDVWLYPGSQTDLVMAREPTNCVDAELTFSVGAASSPSGSTDATEATATPPATGAIDGAAEPVTTSATGSTTTTVPGAGTP